MTWAEEYYGPVHLAENVNGERAAYGAGGRERQEAPRPRAPQSKQHEDDEFQAAIRASQTVAEEEDAFRRALDHERLLSELEGCEHLSRAGQSEVVTEDLISLIEDAMVAGAPLTIRYAGGTHPMELRSVTPVKWDRDDRSRLRAWCHRNGNARYFLPRRMLEVWDTAGAREAAALAREREMVATHAWEARHLVNAAVVWRRGAATARCDVSARRLRAGRVLTKALVEALQQADTAKLAAVHVWRQLCDEASVAAWAPPEMSTLGDCFVMPKKARKGKKKAVKIEEQLEAQLKARAKAKKKVPPPVDTFKRAMDTFMDDLRMDAFLDDGLQVPKRAAPPIANPFGDARPVQTHGKPQCEVDDEIQVRQLQQELEQPLQQELEQMLQEQEEELQQEEEQLEEQLQEHEEEQEAVQDVPPARVEVVEEEEQDGSQEESQEDSEGDMWSACVEEWETLLQDLEDMGFEDRDANRTMLATCGGDLTKTIKALVSAERAAAGL